MRAGERGYALLLAIAVVAALAIAVLGSARALSDVTTSAARLQEGRTEIVAAESLMSRLTFALLTQETTARSVVMSDNVRRAGEELRLDGAWYGVNGARGAYVSVQDEAGLFNLNSADEQGLAALLAVAGAGNESLTLAARLMDYTDGDDFTRDRGAEGRDYERAGLPPPADRPLSSRWQAIEALGWRDRRIETGPVWGWVAVGRSESGLNINTAPAPVLEAALGDRRRARTIIAQREAGPLTDIAQVEALTGGTARANGVNFVVAPGRGFRVQAVFGSRGRLHGIERRLELGGAEAARPFEWGEEREVRLAPFQNGDSINSLSLDTPAS